MNDEKRALNYIASISPENWQQISREIRADNRIQMWIRAMISVHNARPYIEAMVSAEVLGRICRARMISKVKVERPFYDLTKESHIPLAPFQDPRQHAAGHGSEAVQRFLLRSVTPPDHRERPGTVGSQDAGEVHRDPTLEDRRRELRASHRYQQDHQTPDDDPSSKGAA